MAIAPARRGGTKCRKNSPQVTVFSQSGEATMLRAGREDLFAYTNTPNTRLRRLCAVRNQTLCGGTMESRPTDGFAANRLLYRSFDRLSTLSFRVRVTLLHQLTEQNQTYTMSFRALVEKSPAGEMETIVHPLPKIPASGGSPPRNPPRWRMKQSYTLLCGGTRASRPTDGFAANRLLYRSFDRLSTLSFRVRVTLLHQLTEQNQTYTMSFRALVEKSPAVETETIVHPLPKILARGGAPPRNPLREKRNQTYTTNPNTCPQGLPASPARRVNDFCIFRSRRR